MYAVFALLAWVCASLPQYLPDARADPVVSVVIRHSFPESCFHSGRCP